MAKQRPNHLTGNAGEVSGSDNAGPISDAAARRWLLGIALAGFAAFCLVLFTGRASPGLPGMLVHLLAALGIAVGFTIAAAVTLALVIMATTPPAPIRPTRGQGPLGPVLDELEAVRRLAKRLAFRRSLWMAPLGACAGIAAGSFWAWVNDYDPVQVGFIGLLAGVSAGYAIAASPAARSYARLYKSRVVPMLIGTSSELHYRRPPKDQLQPLQALFRFDVLRGDDALVGSYRGLPVVIAQVRALRRRPLRNSKVAFEGLVVEVALLNHLSGDTIIQPALSGSLAQETKPHGLERVDLEDRAFESAYKVYSNDQVMARALLTPDFMERFRNLDRRGRFGQPFCLGRADDLFVALPTPPGSTIFTPPDFDKQAAADPDVLAQLKADFAAVLRLIDSVIDLDSRTRVAASPAPAEAHASRRPTRRSRP